MSEWRDPARWARLCSGEDCVIRGQGRPNDIATELDSAWVTMNVDSAMRGDACLVVRRHAVEPHDLSATEGATLTIPHLHMHVYPRYPGEPFEDVER